MVVRKITAEETFPLRHKILSDGQTIDEVGRPGDDVALHFGWFEEDDNRITGVISVYPQDESENNSKEFWRIRGMAVDTELQGKGIGAKLLVYTEQHLESNYNLKSIWCNARKPAKGFYEKFGYIVVDEVRVTYPYEGMSYRMKKVFKE